jgi:hypothetical protein
MNMQPSFTNARSFTVYQFSRLRMQALRDAFITKVRGGVSALKIFPLQGDHPNRKYLGVKNIRLHEIVGSLNRPSDFDQKFRPLGKHLLDRWVNAALNRESGGWSPILVHKIGNEYYVEDGHLRVSVARFSGMVFIEAAVWEYSTQCHRVCDCQSKQYAERSGLKTYAAQ